MHIRGFSKDLLPQAINLLAHSDSTPRTITTWEGNGIVGVFAFENKDMVGLIPLEPREIKINPQTYMPVMWVTGAHVQEAFRSKGIGRMMDEQIASLYPQAQAVFAFRQDEGTRAYQWYMNMGYKPLCEISAFRKDIGHHQSLIGYKVYVGQKEIQGIEAQLLPLFEKHTVAAIGFLRRKNNFWSHICTHHYYVASYKYALITLEDKGKIIAYAFVGITDMRDKIKRLEILEWICSEDESLRRKLFEAAFDYAKKNNLSEIRIQCIEHDPIKGWLQSQGFTQRWQTFIVAKALKPKALDSIDVKKWKYFQIDYI